MLIAAYSGRALAASARRGGYAPLVADFFGDDDTLAVARAYVRLRSGMDHGIDADELEDAFARLAAGASPAGIVCGTGFEDRTGILARMGARWPLIGNTPDVIARCKAPDDFAATCRRGGVLHPEITHAPPDDPSGWLVKRVGGAGGTHIKAAGIEARAPDGSYYQRHVGGKPVSALVLADGRNAIVLGFSIQWVSSTSNHPFRFGGAAQPAPISAATAAAMTASVQRLSAELALVGLNSFDFLLADDEFHLLEINPRPGATLDIFEPSGGSLFAWHVAACRGELPQVLPNEAGQSQAVAVFTSPRLRGEVDIGAHSARMSGEGAFPRTQNPPQEPLTPTLSPQERGEGEAGAAPCATALPHDVARAMMIVYASDIIRTMPAFDWPEWAADRPPAGTYVSVDTPFCTVTASAATAAEARHLVEARAASIFADAQARLS